MNKQHAFSVAVVAVVGALTGCGGSSSALADQARTAGNGGASESSGGSSLAAGGASALGNGGNSDPSGGSSGGGSAVGGRSGSGGSAGVASPSGALGPSGCGLDAAAFCDPFDAKVDALSRAGELDSKKWSGGRLPGHVTTDGMFAFSVGTATLRPIRTVGGVASQLPLCRTGVSDRVSPDEDTLVCGSSADIKSNHLLVAVASQNYGENSYRIRRPFDFAGRTGKIVFDAEAFDGNNDGQGWISLEITADPIPTPGFAVGNYSNLEGTAIPENGVTLVLSGDQGSVLRRICLFKDFVETDVETDSKNLVKVATDWGKLNHFEVAVSQQKIELFASPASADGRTFDPPRLVYSQGVDLPFSRGYVHITTHNHASWKYSSGGSAGNGGFTNLDAWIARWDNVGFDGPILDDTREYEIADSLAPNQNGTEASATAINIGWRVPDEMDGPKGKLTFHGVDPKGMTKARIAISSFYDHQAPDAYVLKYRINGGQFHDRPFSPGELSHARTPAVANGVYAQMLDVPISELVAGDNTLEFVSKNIPQQYPPAVANIDLILSK